MRKHTRVFVATLMMAFFLTSQAPSASATSPTPSLVVGGLDNTPSSTGFAGTGQPALDTTGHRLFVPDYANNRVAVYMLDSSNVPLHTYADYVLGQPNLTTKTAATTQSGMDSPGSAAYEAGTQRLFVVDENNTRVLVFDTSSLSNGMNASHVIGHSTFTDSTGGRANDKFDSATSLALDEAGHRLFVTDHWANRVLVFDTASITDGMSASYILGQTSSNVVAQNRMITPDGLAYDPTTNLLYVADSGANRVMVYDGTSIANAMNASYVIGQPNYTDSTARSTVDGLSYSEGMSIDVPGRRLYLADAANHRVVSFDLSALATHMSASNVWGQPDFTSNSSGSSSTEMNSPLGVNWDGVGHHLIVSDTYNSRLLYFDVASPGTTSSVATVIDPTLTFLVAAHSLACNGVSQTAGTVSLASAASLGHVNSTANGVVAQDLAVTTNATLGYTVFARTVGQMSDGNGHTVADVSGSNAAPGAFPAAGTAAFGYTTNDAALGTGTANRFTNGGAKWAPMTGTNAEVSYAATGPVTNDTACIAYQLGVAANTPAGTYSTTIVYTAVAKF